MPPTQESVGKYHFHPKCNTWRYRIIVSFISTCLNKESGCFILILLSIDVSMIQCWLCKGSYLRCSLSRAPPIHRWNVNQGVCEPSACLITVFAVGSLDQFPCGLGENILSWRRETVIANDIQIPMASAQVAVFFLKYFWFWVRVKSFFLRFFPMIRWWSLHPQLYVCFARLSQSQVLFPRQCRTVVEQWRSFWGYL